MLENTQSNLLQVLMKPMQIASISGLIQEAFRYYQMRIEKILPSGQSLRHETGVMKKRENFVTEIMVYPSSTGKMVAERGERLRGALENVNNAIKIVEKGKEL